MKYFIAFILLVSVTTPIVSYAQTNDEYRAYLLSVIALLQEQIKMLQSQLESQKDAATAVDTDFESFILPSSADVIARYHISNAKAVAGITDKTSRLFFEHFFSLVPAEFDNDIVELVVFEAEDEMDAFVETVSSQNDLEWRFGVSTEVFLYPVNDEATSELFIHEFAHVLSYASIPTLSISGPTSCHKYFEGFGCPPEDSYFTAFLDDFWSDSDLDSLIDFGDNVWSSSEQKYYFVSTYAATAPEEDFAESFAQFVLQTRQSNATIAKQKTNFFYQYPELVEMRKEIRANL